MVTEAKKLIIANSRYFEDNMQIIAAISGRIKKIR